MGLHHRDSDRWLRGGGERILRQSVVGSLRGARTPDRILGGRALQPLSMARYGLFGGVLRSDVDFPELSPAPEGPARWELSTVPAAPERPGLVLLGREPVEPGVTVGLFRDDAGLRLAFDDTGSFDISLDGSRIAWSPPASPNLSAVRKDVLGRVLAVCLQRQGVVALHGSAVDLQGAGICFLAPKFHGKSTTAAALVDAGARLIADDLVAVAVGPTPTLLPSVPWLQLWRDSAERVGVTSQQVPGTEREAKAQRRWADRRDAEAAHVPFAAVYLLAPVADGPEAVVRRVPLGGVEGALALLSQAKIVQLLGVEGRGELLGALSALTGHVPVYRLEVPRSFERLPELVQALQEWHRAPGPA